MRASELFAMFMEERKNTGLPTNECRLPNTHGAFIEDVAPLRLSNLCCEINF